MKLLLIGLDGVRVDVALPQALTMHRGFEEPDHPADPRFAAGERPAGAPMMPSPALSSATPAPTLARLLDGGCVLPVWMTPPTDSGPGWASLLTGTRHEQNNVWWNEFVGHRLARTPDILSRLYFANPSARTFAASTWDALVDPSGPGPVFHQRVDQQVGGQHQLMKASDFSEGAAAPIPRCGGMPPGCSTTRAPMPRSCTSRTSTRQATNTAPPLPSTGRRSRGSTSTCVIW